MSGIDDLRRMVLEQQQEIHRLEAQVGNQPAQAPANGATIQPADYPSAASTAGAAPAPAASGSADQLPPGATIVGNDKTPLTAAWNSGLIFESANKEFTLHVGGRIEWDAGTYHAPASTVTELRALNNTPTSPGNANGWQNFQNNIDFRRARLRTDGTIYENIDFGVELEFANSFAVVRPNKAGAGGTLSTGAANSTIANSANLIDAVTPTWVFVTVKDIPILGNVRTGQFLVPFSFDLATSDTVGDFIERSAAFDVFVPNCNTGNFVQGIEFFDHNEDLTMTWWNSVSLNNENDPFNGIALANDATSWTGRVTWLPYYDEASGGRYLVHVGLDGQAQGLERDVINFHDRGDVHEPYSIAPSMVNQNIVGTYSELVCGEFVTVWGPWEVQSECYATEVNGSNATGTAKATTNLFFEGGYAQVMYFLTGENRNYVRTLGGFTRVVPFSNFINIPGERTSCGLGAWEVGARYSWVDLNDQGVHGGIVGETTVGLNWWLNPNLHYSFNYAYTRVTDIGAAAATESVNGFGVRMTMEF